MNVFLEISRPSGGSEMLSLKSRPYAVFCGLLCVMCLQALWAIPFALFFGLLNDPSNGFGVYVTAFKVSLVFAYSIGLAMWVVRFFVAPRLRQCPPDLSPARVFQVGGAYVASAILSSYLAAYIIHLTIVPGFL